MNHFHTASNDQRFPGEYIDREVDRAMSHAKHHLASGAKSVVIDTCDREECFALDIEVKQ